MGRLIDADALLIQIRQIDFLKTPNSTKLSACEIMSIINKQQTAYSVKNVVAELEEAKEKVANEDYCRTKHYVENDCEHKDCFKCCSEYLIDIVKRGGVDERN